MMRSVMLGCSECDKCLYVARVCIINAPTHVLSIRNSRPVFDLPFRLSQLDMQLDAEIPVARHCRAQNR